MGLAQPRPAGEFTRADYLGWPEGERRELIDGPAYAMSPVTTNWHQRLGGNLFARIHHHLRGKPCRPFMAPLDVRLPKAGTVAHEIDTVAQPDISVVCDAEKLKDNRGCLGAPDGVIEVVSASTAMRDQKIKRAPSERHGVPEYWLAHPVDRSVTICRMSERGHEKPLIFGVGEECARATFPDRVTPLADVFADLPPLDEAIVG